VAKAAARDPLLAKAQALGNGELMGYLSRVIRDPQRIAVAEHFANRHDLDGVLAQLSLEECSQLGRTLQGL
jgi:hypothetical protein